MLLTSGTTQAGPRWEAFRSNFSIFIAFLPLLDLAESLFPNLKLGGNHSDLLRVGCKKGSCCVVFCLLKIIVLVYKAFFIQKAKDL